jgi:aspartate/methionine/tyrosine aminotransferase
LLFNVLLDPGDHVLAVNPAYQQLNSVPRAVGAEVALWRIVPKSYGYDLDELERLLELANRLSEERGVMLAPGSAFGFEHYLRIGIGQDPPVFAEGLRRAGAFLDQLRES